MVRKNECYIGSVDWNFNGIINRSGSSAFDLTDPNKFEVCINQLRNDYNEAYKARIDTEANRDIQPGDLIHYGMFLFRVIKVDNKEIKLLQENTLDRCTLNDIEGVLDDDNDDYMMLDFLLYAIPQFGPLKCAVSLLHLPFDLNEEDCVGWPEGIKDFALESFWAFNHRTDGSIELVAARQSHKYPICSINNRSICPPNSQLPIRFMLTMKHDAEHLELLRRYRIYKV